MLVTAEKALSMLLAWATEIWNLVVRFDIFLWPLALWLIRKAMRFFDVIKR